MTHKTVSMIRHNKTTGLFFLFYAFLSIILSQSTVYAVENDHYQRWKTVGEKIGELSLTLFDYEQYHPGDTTQLVAMTNAGYAEMLNESTRPLLDGLSESLGISRGAGTLVEVHSSYQDPLWFAVYDKVSGYCLYGVINPDEIASITNGNAVRLWSLFKTGAVEKIDAQYLFQHPEKWPVSFGSNAFRVVTIMNGVTAGVPTYALKSFEFHDHYCPGVSSGLLIANFVKKYFKNAGVGSFFVHGLQPWCKEDALITILNATPGKTGYVVSYPTQDDLAKWTFPKAHNIIYHQNANTGLWEGIMVEFVWGDTSHCNKYLEADNVTKGSVAKLCSDMWYLEKLDKPEDFVKPVYKFTLEKGKAPKDYARPGFDIMLPGNLPAGELIN